MGGHNAPPILIRVKHLYGLVDELNDTQTQMTGMKPSDAIKLNQVLLVNRENYPPEDTLSEDGLYWYLLQQGILICLKLFGGLEENLRCIRSFMFISLSDVKWKV